MIRTSHSPPVSATDAGERVPSERPSHVRLLVLLTLTHLVVDAYATTVPALLPFWQARFALSYGLAGLVTGIANVTSSVAQPLVGLLTERTRNTRWVAFACVVAAVGVSSTGLAPTFGVFLFLIVLGNLGVSAFHPQGYKLIGLYSGPRPAVATSWFLVGGNVGVALGPPLGTAAVIAFGTPGTATLVLPGLVLASALLWLVPRWTKVRPEAGERVDGLDGAGRDVAPGRATTVPVAPNPAVAALRFERRAMAIVVLVTLVAVRSAVSGTLTSYVPLYYVRVANTGETVASLVLTGMLLAGAAATLAGGYLADRIGRLRVLAATLSLTPPLLLLFLAAPLGSWAAVAALWGAGAMVTASFSITVVLAQELWYERRALASGVIVGFAFGLGGLFVPLVGIIADRAGLQAAFQVVAFVPLLALVLAGVLALLLRPARRLSAA
jgi:FSR family fosmidomycin resistance protein-like MFS transporter